MLGPSTSMVAGVFAHLPVRMLAGAIPVDKDSVLKAIRYGVGAPCHSSVQPQGSSVAAAGMIEKRVVQHYLICTTGKMESNREFFLS